MNIDFYGYGVGAGRNDRIDGIVGDSPVDDAFGADNQLAADLSLNASAVLRRDW